MLTLFLFFFFLFQTRNSSLFIVVDKLLGIIKCNILKCIERFVFIKQLLALRGFRKERGQ